MTAQFLPILSGHGGVDVSDGNEAHVFMMRGTASDVGPAPDTWTSINLTQFGNPVDAVCVDVQGLLIITMGSTAGFCGLHAAFRRPGDQAVTIRGHYTMQCVANTNDGMRSNAACIVTPVNGVIEWGWFFNGQTQLAWPTFAACGINLTFNRWMR